MKVLITGSSSGIGKAIKELFLARGHKVIAMDRIEDSQENPGCLFYQKDIFYDTLPEIEDIDILINNAGIQEGEDTIDVNLKGTIRVTEKYAFQPQLKSVLFIASSSAINGAEFPEYAASKGGMVSYMKNVASRVSKYGATSNALSPGGVITPLNRHILADKKLYEEVLNETLLHKWATAEEIAQWAYFLTVVNHSMTAQNLLIDNGEMAKLHFVW